MRTMAAFLISLLLAACSSGQLEITSYRYNGPIQGLTTKEIERISSDARTIRDQSERVKACRISSANLVFDFYDTYQEFIVFIRSRGERDYKSNPTFVEGKAQFERTLDYYQQTINNTLDLVDAELSPYFEDIVKNAGNIEPTKTGNSRMLDKFEIYGLLHTAYRLLQEMNGDLGTGFEEVRVFIEEYFQEYPLDPEALIESLSLADQVDTQSEDFEEISRVLFGRLSNIFDEFSRQAGEQCLSDAQMNNLQQAQAEINGRIQTPLDKNIRWQVVEGIVDISTARVKSGAPLLGALFLARDMDLLFSQVDRLQDPTDTFWTKALVDNDENEEYWDVEFSKTYYRAEGNSAIVVVRERPGHYRVQKAKNDPKVLIQNQLKITRALGAGLIDVVGAFSGAGPLTDKVLPEGGEGQGDSGNDDDKPNAETLAAAGAKVDETQQMRKIGRENLEKRLEAIREEVEGGGSTVDPGTISQLQGLLKSSKAIFNMLGEGED